MTYDEVEKILGRPSQIQRGVRQLISRYGTKHSTYESWKLLTAENEPQPEIETIGQLLYVVWQYDDTSQRDTVFKNISRKKQLSILSMECHRASRITKPHNGLIGIRTGDMI